MRLPTLAAVLLLITGTVHAQETCPEPMAAADLLNSHYPSSLDNSGPWHHRQSTAADLDGDGASETIHLLANIEVVDGVPGWDDGQSWEIVIEEDGGAETPAYRQFVQMGKVDLAVIENEEEYDLLVRRLVSNWLWSD